MTKEINKIQNNMVNGKIKNIVGMKYGNLTVLNITHKNKNGAYCWNCVCDCGTKLNVSGLALRSGNTKSCGCLQKEIVRNIGIKNRKYFEDNKSEYNSWSGMKTRCLNKNNHAYKDYGGRGVMVCNEWLEFENFYKDMGKRPKGLTLDRIDNDGNYCKENCRWATQKEQTRNTRRNRYIKFEDRNFSISQWAETLRIKPSTLWMRLYKYDWSIKRALCK